MHNQPGRLGKHLRQAGAAALIAVASGLAGCATQGETAASADHAGHDVSAGADGASLRHDGSPLLEGIGPTGMTITTAVPRAQAYFNQGLTLAYGFNHAEAVRSFREAARLDPGCGICYWGVALALGPNINAPMGAEAIPEAWAAVQQAQALAGNESNRERAYIDAVSVRYSQTGDDRVVLDQLYAGAMRGLVERYPEDRNARVLYAESLMDLVPWSYWNEDRSPGTYTEDIVTALESVMAEEPDHVGALHLYIHTMEQFFPGRAVTAADRLGPLVPVAGHLVHMPSHIYLRVGRYDDAVEANRRAALADEDYIAQCNAQGFYPAAYHPHNVHFLWYAAVMGGRQSLAIATARRLVGNVHLELAKQFGSIQQFLAVPATTYVRFGLWEEALAEPPPPAGVPLATAFWHYTQGVASAAVGNARAARAQLKVLEQMAADGAVSEVAFRPGIPVAETLLEIGTQLVRARLARLGDDGAAELAALQAAVAAQDSLPYTEPPFWHFPVRQALGAAQLRHGDSVAAAATFREDLVHFPRNGWSVSGLLRANPDATDRDALQAMLDDTWKQADADPQAGL
jgi:tetratricopeptide (TPR) repeat protein